MKRNSRYDIDSNCSYEASRARHLIFTVLTFVAAILIIGILTFAGIES